MLSARLSFSFAIVFFRGIFRSISTILQADRIPPCLFHSLSAVYMFCVSRWTFCCCYQACSLHLLFTYLLVFPFFSLNNSFVTDLGACVCQCRYYLSRSLNELLFFAPSRFAQCFLSTRYIRLREKNAKRNVNVYLCISPSSASAQRFSWIFCGFCSNPKQKSISFCSVGLLLLLSLLLSLLFSYSKLFGRRFDIHACFVWWFSNRVSSHQLKNLSLWNGFRMHPFFFFFVFCCCWSETLRTD